MRFRANIDNVPTFLRIIQSIEKLSKKCTIRLTEETIRIICNTESEGGVIIWSQIKIHTLFSDYRVQSNANNEITIVLATEPLLHVLKSATSSSEVVTKLAKRNGVPCLSFDLSLQSKQGKEVKITHDVKIMVMKQAEVELITEPLCPAPDVHIILPPLQKVRTVVDRMRSLSNVVGISANKTGQLKLSIQTQKIKADTVWSNLTNPDVPGGERAEDDERPREPEAPPEQYHSVLVSVRSLTRFLNAYVISTTTIACICAGHCIIMYVYIGEVGNAGGVLTFYIPALLDGVED